MKCLLSVFKKINGKIEQWNLAREGHESMSEELERAYIADEAARLREQWRLDEIRLRIKKYKDLREFEFMQQKH